MRSLELHQNFCECCGEFACRNVNQEDHVSSCEQCFTELNSVLIPYKDEPIIYDDADNFENAAAISSRSPLFFKELGINEADVKLIMSFEAC